MSVKTQFSIKDLENLSNVKAHTIRIWEKRYQLLTPERTETNIRKYNLLNLKKLLNVSFLYAEGFKISKIADLSDEELCSIVKDQRLNQNDEAVLTTFKSAMFDFDAGLFSITYKQLKKHRDFRTIFFEIFMPLLDEIGLLWQTGTIDPSHERFISELIKQKVILNIESLQQHTIKEAPVFSLYLPYEEIHEIGLLYANYELLTAGFKTIYLGNNIPIDSLKYVVKHQPDAIFLSYFTVKPETEHLENYLHEFREKIMPGNTCSLWLMGRKTQEMKLLPDKRFQIIRDLKALHKKLEALNIS